MDLCRSPRRSQVGSSIDSQIEVASFLFWLELSSIGWEVEEIIAPHFEHLGSMSKGWAAANWDLLGPSNLERKARYECTKNEFVGSCGSVFS